MTRLRSGRMAFAMAAMILALTGGGALAGDLPPLDGLEKGAWELRSHDPAGPIFNICLGDSRRLLQLHNLGQRCNYYVIEAKPDELTVTYICPGAGRGRTTLRVETRRLVQIHTQGVANGAPFADMIEGRRKGECR
jgi:hypothetical protein